MKIKAMIREITALLVLLLSISSASAANRYWIAAATANWNSTANWSSTSGGASGSSVPGSGDIAIFDGNGTGNCTVNAAIDVAGINVNSAYTGTISQGANTITVGSSNGVFSGGTFSGGSSSITMNGTLTISGTAFSSTSNVITLNSNFTRSSGSFTSNSGTVKANASLSISGSMTFNHFELSGASAMTVTIASGTTITVRGNLTYNGSSAITVATANIDAQGDIYLNNTSAAGGGSATLTINGTNTQTLYGYSSSSAISRLPHVVITKGSSTLRVNDNLSVAGNWTYNSGTISHSNSGVIFVTSKSISGSMDFNNLAFLNGTHTIASGTILTVNGFLQTAGASACIINGSTATINLHRDLVIGNTGTGGGGDATIKLVGGGEQIISGNGIANTGRLCKIVIDQSPGGAVDLTGTISCANDFTYIQGTVNPGSSTVAICTSSNLDAQGTSTNMSFNELFIYAGTTTLTGYATIGGALRINTGATLTPGSNGIAIGGDWLDYGTYVAGTSAVTFNGSLQNIYSAAGSETYSQAIMSSSGKVTLVSPVRITSGLTLTTGAIETTSTNILIIADNVTVTGGSNASYVSGPVKKIGNDVFTFPLGYTGSSNSYHPLTITAPSSASDEFTACYFFSDPVTTYGSTMGTGIDNITTCEYWTLEQVSGTSSVTPTLSYNDPACGIDPYDGTVARWNGSQWADHGKVSYNVNGSLYSLTATTAISTFSPDPAPLALGIKNRQYNAVLKKKLDGGYYTAINSKLKFKFDEEYKDSDNTLTYNIYSDMNRLVGSTPSQAVQYGDNRYTIDLTSITGMTTGYYILEVKNEKNEKWYLRFKY